MPGELHGLSLEDFEKIYDAMECLAVVHMKQKHDEHDIKRRELVKKLFSGNDSDMQAYIKEFLDLVAGDADAYHNA